MAEQSAFESFPNEIIFVVLSYLEPRDIVVLQNCGSQRLLRICRDSQFWRLRCYEESTFLEGIRRRHAQFSGDDETPLSAVLGAQHSEQGTTTPQPPRVAIQNERLRILANWDPSFKGERVSWYNEYIQRHGPVAVNWYEQPQIKDGALKDTIEVKGAALYHPVHDQGSVFAVSPLDDGSVCLWDVMGTHGKRKKGSIISKSREGLLSLDSPILSPRSKKASIDITECISVDSSRSRAFIAVQSHLVEVDLQTLQIVGSQPYESTITTMSAAQPSVPLTVGTFHGIYLYDSRSQTEMRRDHNERIDEFDRIRQPGLSHILDSSPLPPYAPLPKDGPLSILHMEQPGSKTLISDDILVAGRFASILHYDRRMFPAIKGAIHSGASLSGLASLPYPSSCLSNDLRQHGALSVEQVEEAKTVPGGRTLIAAGEYKSKGSLELYGFSQSSREGPGASSLVQNSKYINRVNAARAKILSVITHGTRIVYSDGEGFLRWFERDGSTEVRRHKIGHSEKVAQRSLFASMPGSDEIARKILSTQTVETGADSGVNNEDILFWTGEKLGVVGFSTRPGSNAEDFDDEDRTPEEIAVEEEGQLYNERMRVALERQANDVRFVRFLGAGIRPGF